MTEMSKDQIDSFLSAMDEASTDQLKFMLSAIQGEVSLRRLKSGDHYDKR